MGASSLLVLVFAAVAFAAGGMAVAKIFVKGSSNPQKGQAYESGIKSETSPWNQFNVGYYLFALIFLIYRCRIDFYVSLGCSGKENRYACTFWHDCILLYTFYGFFICS
jgi:NADH:ubiquinone oxidoreductase subunit 3 (subunit A)